MKELTPFQKAILEGLPDALPPFKPLNAKVSHAPKRVIEHLTDREKQLALKNALRYFHPKHHTVLAPEFAQELEQYGASFQTRLRDVCASNHRLSL